LDSWILVANGQKRQQWQTQRATKRPDGWGLIMIKAVCSAQNIKTPPAASLWRGYPESVKSETCRKWRAKKRFYSLLRWHDSLPRIARIPSYYVFNRRELPAIKAGACRAAGQELYAANFAAVEVDKIGADDLRQLIIGPLDQNVGAHLADEFLWSFLGKINDIIDEFQRCQHSGAVGLPVDRPAGAFDFSYRRRDSYRRPTKYS
jgi:hypothetical protein